MKTTLFKSIFVLSFSFIFSTGNSYSQVFSGYGFKAGAASAFHSHYGLSGSSDYKTSLRFGYTAGLFAELFKLQKFSTVVEINFEQKGGNDKQIHPVVESHYSTLLVLSVPVLAKFTFPSNSHVHPYISFGPRADFLLSKEEGWEVNVYKNINPVNFGMSVSTGAEIPLSKKASILLEAVYSPDLTTYSYQTFLSRNYDVRNTSFEIKTGLLFNR